MAPHPCEHKIQRGAHDPGMFLFFPPGSPRTSESAQLIERLTPVSNDTRMGVFKGMLPFRGNHRPFV